MLTQSESTQLKADIGSLIDAVTEGTTPPPAPTASINLNPTTIIEGQSATLSWSVMHADSVTINGVTSTFSGTQEVSPDVDTVYVLDATGPGGTVQVQASLTVTPEPPTPPGNTIGPGLVYFEEIHVHTGDTTTILPGTELVRLDVPPQDPGHGDGGIVVHGTLIAVREENEDPIIIRSENPSGYRGHLMCHGDMQLDGVEIRDFGRTKIDLLNSVSNPIARYAVHWHEAGNRPNSYIKNCLIHDTVVPSVFRHGIVLHATNQVLVKDNVIREKGGTGIFTEDGSETDNIIEGNVCEYIRNRNGLNTATLVPPRPIERNVASNDFGFEGAGIWLRGPKNIVRNNTSRFCGIGHEMYFNAAINQYEPINVWEDNVAEDCHSGFQPWHVGLEGSASPNPQVISQRQYMHRFTARRCKLGTFAYFQGRVTWVDFVIEDCWPNGVLAGGDYRQYEGEIDGITVSGSKFGIQAPWFVEGGYTIKDAVLSDNETDLQVHIMYHSADGRNLTPCVVTYTNCQFNSTNKIKMDVPVAGNRNYIQVHKTLIEDYQGVADDNFQVFFNEQSPTQILPQTANGGKIVGSPVSGLTNEQNLAQHGVCWAGEIYPSNVTTRPGIVGKVSQ